MREADDVPFDPFAWHDDSLYGLALQLGDPAANDWCSDFVFDLDHIVEWVRDGDRTRFRMAPAKLVFHGVSDLRIDIDWGMRGSQVSASPAAIDRIERNRMRTEEQRIFLDRPYYTWRVVFSWPNGASIAFGALGCELTLRREPMLLDEQRVPASLRDGGA